MGDATFLSTFKSIFYMIGAACLLVSLAWVLQAARFTGDDVQAAAVIWTIMGSAVAGIGTGCFLAARYWTATAA